MTITFLIQLSALIGIISATILDDCYLPQSTDSSINLLMYYNQQVLLDVSVEQRHSTRLLVFEKETDDSTVKAIYRLGHETDPEGYIGIVGDVSTESFTYNIYIQAKNLTVVQNAIGVSGMYKDVKCSNFKNEATETLEYFNSYINNALDYDRHEVQVTSQGRKLSHHHSKRRLEQIIATDDRKTPHIQTGNDTNNDTVRTSKSKTQVNSPQDAMSRITDNSMLKNSSFYNISTVNNFDDFQKNNTSILSNIPNTFSGTGDRPTGNAAFDTFFKSDNTTGVNKLTAFNATDLLSNPKTGNFTNFANFSNFNNFGGQDALNFHNNINDKDTANVTTQIGKHDSVTATPSVSNSQNLDTTTQKPNGSQNNSGASTNTSKPNVSQNNGGADTNTSKPNGSQNNSGAITSTSRPNGSQNNSDSNTNSKPVYIGASNPDTSNINGDPKSATTTTNAGSDSKPIVASSTSNNYKTATTTNTGNDVKISGASTQSVNNTNNSPSQTTVQPQNDYRPLLTSSDNASTQKVSTDNSLNALNGSRIKLAYIDVLMKAYGFDTNRFLQANINISALVTPRTTNGRLLDEVVNIVSIKSLTKDQNKEKMDSFRVSPFN